MAPWCMPTTLLQRVNARMRPLWKQSAAYRKLKKSIARIGKNKNSVDN